MPGEPGKSGLLRSASPTRVGKGRRSGFDEEPRWRGFVDDVVTSSLGPGVIVAAVFAALASAILLWTREQSLVAVGRVMDETRIVRVKLEVEDREQTEQKRSAARQATPRVFAANVSVLTEIQTSLENLPGTLAGVEGIDKVDASIRAQFGLTPEALLALKDAASNGVPTISWKGMVGRLLVTLRRRPILDAETWQRQAQEGTHTSVRLFVGDEELPPVYRGELLNLGDKDFRVAMEAVARDAGFSGDLRDVVVARLMSEPKPTYRFDSAATARDQNAAAEAVRPTIQISPPGQVIFQRGDVLAVDQADLFVRELRRFEAAIEPWRLLLRRGALVLVVCAITLGLVGYTVMFCPRVMRNISRMAGVAVILLTAMAAACGLTAAFPGTKALTATIPSVVVALIVSIGYDRRAALAYGLLHGLLVCIAMRETIGCMMVIITGIACIVTTLDDIRDRNSLFRMSVLTAMGVASGTVLMAIADRPIFGTIGAVSGAPITDTGLLVIRETLWDATLAGTGALIAGGATLFVLPVIERIFGVTTGMTLVELRDPKQPLLRELQMRAPGTYNHSLNVASIAESAAEAIKADGLLTYVGALYHDVGKMNKPEYFVENQTGGPNKHDKLSPAMSLLVVVGHVKDGMEMAREYGLPRNVQHFIESHHGTTLVEYFYHRARQIAEESGGDESRVPDEIEYRYPGPRPRTKEAAVLMIADAVESATRSMSDPTPSRIDALVRSIANKRLLDGQFDECELTLRELTLIVESISRTLASMYHGRIAYPTGDGDEPAEARGDGRDQETRGADRSSFSTRLIELPHTQGGEGKTKGTGTGTG